MNYEWGEGMEQAELASDHMWTLRKSIESRMNAIAETHKQASMIYHELYGLIYEYEDIINLTRHGESYDD